MSAHPGFGQGAGQAAQAEQAERAARAAEQAARAAEQASERAIEQAIRAAERAAEASGQGFPPPPPMPPGGFEGVTVQTGPMPGYVRDRPSDDTIVMISVAFFLMVIVLAIGIPFVRALSRKWERQAAGGAGPDVEHRLARIEQAVEAVAVEVERIGEGQRYATQVMSELRALPSGDAAAAERALLDRAAQAASQAASQVPRDRVR